MALGQAARRNARLRIAMRAALCALAAAGCASSYYDEYRAQHPGFDACLPCVHATLPELLAALHAPAGGETVEVTLDSLTVFEVDGTRWGEIPFDAIRSGSLVPADGSDYAVLVSWRCRSLQGLQPTGSLRAGYYLLPGNRVTAYDHYAFRDRCTATDEFVAARGPLMALEREAFSRLPPYGARITLATAYRRGLAYLEAGRLDDARRMLVLGERSYRESVEDLRAKGQGESLAEAERSREALMRALGVEAVDPPTR